MADTASVVAKVMSVVDNTNTAPKPKRIGQILKTKTADLTPEERDIKLNYYRKYNDTEKHRATVREYRSKNLDKIKELNRSYRQRVKQRAVEMLTNNADDGGEE
jgi:ribosome recycling factor